MVMVDTCLQFDVHIKQLRTGAPTLLVLHPIYILVTWQCEVQALWEHLGVSENRLNP